MGEQHRQTAREAAIAEALGEAIQVLDRLDELKGQLPTMADKVTAELRRSSETARNDIENARVSLTRDLEAYVTSAQGELLAAAERTDVAAARLERAQRRTTTLALCAGMVGGVLVAALLGIGAAIVIM